METKKVFYIIGMTCNHCVMAVKKAISAVRGVTNVEVNLNEQKAYVEGDFNEQDIRDTVDDAGYKVAE